MLKLNIMVLIVNSYKLLTSQQLWKVVEYCGIDIYVKCGKLWNFTNDLII